MQEVFERLRVSKTYTTPFHTKSDGMVERYIKTVETHLQKVVLSHRKDWDARLSIFLFT
jgi:hypothetical protein